MFIASFGSVLLSDRSSPLTIAWIVKIGSYAEHSARNVSFPVVSAHGEWHDMLFEPLKINWQTSISKATLLKARLVINYLDEWEQRSPILRCLFQFHHTLRSIHYHKVAEELLAPRTGSLRVEFHQLLSRQPCRNPKWLARCSSESLRIEDGDDTPERRTNDRLRRGLLIRPTSWSSWLKCF